jgi:hypothetical protein
VRVAHTRDMKEGHVLGSHMRVTYEGNQKQVDVEERHKFDNLRTLDKKVLKRKRHDADDEDLAKPQQC